VFVNPIIATKEIKIKGGKIMQNLPRFLVISCLFAVILGKEMNAQWVATEQLPSGGGIGGIYSLASSGTNVFAGTYNNGVFLTTDNGTTWTEKGSGLTNKSVWSLTVSGSNVFAGTDGGGVFLSTNNGSEWTGVSSGLPDNTTIYSLDVLGTNIFAGTGEGLFLTTNNGASWTEADSGISSPSVRALAVSPNGTGGSNLFAASFVNVYLSTNNGTSWDNVSSGLPTNSLIQSLIVIGSNIFAGSSAGVYLSTDNGESWNEMNNGLTDKQIWDFAASGTNLFAGTDDGVFVTTNNGSSWEGTEYDYLSVYALTISETQLFSGGGLGRVYRRPLSEMITDVELYSDRIPSAFYLGQNYPNPFNPTTKIKFAIPKSSFVNLKVYDVLGNEIATLLNEEKPAGLYKIDFDASGLSSGVYFYKLISGGFVETKKMILIR
jgi:photosystem II stability/assembly factor-like uncharacterized protein